MNFFDLRFRGKALRPADPLVPCFRMSHSTEIILMKRKRESKETKSREKKGNIKREKYKFYTYHRPCFATRAFAKSENASISAIQRANREEIQCLDHFLIWNVCREEGIKSERLLLDQ